MLAVLWQYASLDLRPPSVHLLPCAHSSSQLKWRWMDHMQASFWTNNHMGALLTREPRDVITRQLQISFKALDPSSLIVWCGIFFFSFSLYHNNDITNSVERCLVVWFTLRTVAMMVPSLKPTRFETKLELKDLGLTFESKQNLNSKF